ncbi:MAG: trehalose-phosphatase, partial [Bacteroidota bacterium]|nr:trehalose-phosphatase [Bacteroidota bacterium]
IALVTPFRDGMNLVAKEFVASKKDQTGVLILSEMAGSVVELQATLCINPNDIDNIVHAFEMALNMPIKEQKERMAAMQKVISKQTVQKWANDFINTLHNIHQKQILIEAKVLHDDAIIDLKRKYHVADKKLLLLDYDGTLVPYVDKPKDAVPDKELINILENLTESSDSKVVIVSGRDQETLDRWFRDINVDIIAEYGSWSREDFKWKQNNKISDEWKKEIMPYIDEFIEKTPGSFLEEKTHSLVWHYRKVDAWLANLRVQEFLNAFVYPCTKLNLEIMEGKKTIEVRVADIKRHEAVRKWLKQEKWDFIMAIGDDQADEEMFVSLPKNTYSIKVGYGATKAKFHLVSHEDVRELLAYIPKKLKLINKK